MSSTAASQTGSFSFYLGLRFAAAISLISCRRRKEKLGSNTPINVITSCTFSPKDTVASAVLAGPENSGPSVPSFCQDERERGEGTFAVNDLRPYQSIIIHACVVFRSFFVLTTRKVVEFISALGREKGVIII